MVSSSITLTLTAEDRPDRYTLAWGAMKYSIEIRPEMDVILVDLLRRLQPMLAGGRDLSKKFTSGELLQAIGMRLWQALIPDTTPTDEREALERELRTGRAPLLLSLPPSLSVLPWELLFDPQKPNSTGFLVRRRPFVRLIPGGANLPPLSPPLRVLLLISSPPGLEERQRVDVEGERTAIEYATREAREAGLLHLCVEDIVTPRRVQQALLRFKPHILHYIGHGNYQEVGGYLVWEDEQGESMQMFDIPLAELLRPHELRAILLHSCQTASSDIRTEFRSVARVLQEAGIPAVLAQQASFTYESSQRASDMFYMALTNGLGPAEAAFEARQALAQADRPDWAVPVLQATAGGLAPLLDMTVSPGIPDPELADGGGSADLPAPTGIFVGRQRELRSLRVMLENASATGPALALITGPGGIGKSTLAAQAISRYGRGYKVIFTLSCAGYQGMDLFFKQMGEFLHRGGVTEFLEQVLPDPKLSMAEKIEAALAALNQVGPFLLVIDDLESVQQEDHTLSDPDLLLLLRKLLTNLRRGRVLITGRYAIEDLLPDGKLVAHLLRLDLDDLNTRETQQLLERHHSLAQLGEGVRAELIQAFGGLPYLYDVLSSKAASLNLTELIHDAQGRITLEYQQRTAAEWEQVRRQVIEFAALNATVKRLSEQARIVLGQVSIFRRPFPLKALEQGLRVSPADWQSLIDWAFLYYNPVDGTYRPHSLTKRYAEGLLTASERRTTELRIANWYFRYANEESHDLADYLEAHHFLRSAGESQGAGKLANSLWDLLKRLGLYQVWHYLCSTTILDTQGSLAADAQRQLGMMASSQGKYGEAQQWYEKALALFEKEGHSEGCAATLHELGIIAVLQGKYDEARRRYDESSLLQQQLQQVDPSWRAHSLNELGILALYQKQYEEAKQLTEEALQLNEQQDNLLGRAHALHNLGIIAFSQERLVEARRLFNDALSLCKQFGDLPGCANALQSLGNIVSLQGRYREAQRMYSQALTLYERLEDLYGRANTLQSLGNMLSLQERYDEAHQLYQDALPLFKQLGNLRNYVRLLELLGHTSGYQERYEEAKQYYNEILPHLRRLDDLPQYAHILGLLGDLARNQEQYEEAQQYYNEALQLFKQLQDLRGCAALLGLLGDIARHQERYEEAHQCYREALPLFEQLGDLEGRATTLSLLEGISQIREHQDEVKQYELQQLLERATTLYQLGMQAHDQNDYATAVEDLVQSLALFKRLGDQHRCAATLGLLASALILKGEYDEARRLCIASLKLYKRLADLSGCGSITSLLGSIAMEKGNYIEAQRVCGEAVEFFEQMGELEGQAISLHQLGNVLQKQSEYEEARQSYSEALVLFEQLSNKEWLAKTFESLGEIASLQRQEEEAQRWYSKALPLFEQLGDLSSCANIFLQLGIIMQSHESYDEAKKQYSAALPLFEQLGDLRGRANTLYNLGSIGKTLEQYDEARQLSRAALSLFEQLGDLNLRANTLGQLGYIALKQEQYVEARKWYQEALPLIEQLYEVRRRAEIVHNLGTIAQSQKQYEEARRYYSEALPLFEQLGDLIMRANELSQLGSIALGQRRYDEARKWYQEALPLLKQLDNLHEQATVLRDMGLIATLQKQFDVAKRWYSEALPLFKQLNDLRGCAEMLGMLGDIAGIHEHYDRAQQYYSEALASYEQLDDQYGQATTLEQFGVLFHQQGNYSMALQYMLKALALFEHLQSAERKRVFEMIVKLRPVIAEREFASLWREVNGERPLPDLPVARRRLLLPQHLLDFIQAQTWDESQHIVEAHPDLLSQEMDALLEQLAQAQRDTEVRERIELHRQLLTRCREVGIAAAFAELQVDQMQYAEEEHFTAQLNELCRQVVEVLLTGSKKRREKLARQLDHMTNEMPLEGAHDFLALLAAWLRGEDVTERLETLHPDFQDVYRRMLALVTRVDPTNEDDEQKTSLPSQVITLLDQFARADWATRYQLLREHADVLLAESIEAVFDSLLEVNQESEARQFLEELRTLLRRCRIWGVDPAWYLALQMHLGNEIAIPSAHEAAIMQIARLLSQQQKDDGALVAAIESMQELLKGQIDETAAQFKAALLWDLAELMEPLPAGHPLRNLKQMESCYREALAPYEAANRELSVVLLQRSLGNVLTEQGRYEEALEPLQEAIRDLRTHEEYREETAWMLSSYANALDNLGRTEEALVAYREAIMLSPESTPFYRNRAETLIHVRRLKEAEADLGQAVTLEGHENSPYLWYRRAQLAIASGKGRLADQLLDEVAKREASFDVALQRTQAAWLQGRLEAVQETFQHVWEQANQGERAAMRRELERLFAEHSELEGQDIFRSIMGKGDE